ncbi:acyl-CoA/acyl-ACP dehydrogenase [Skermania piniformis]|uniref:Acyl-CoA/acyl-ACP dehydrogenase n=1 Tax=Skermania pinensis TaxID=39122 RepID=A0ABX8SCP1_9ACTN|nr:acyl-CoA/acyl-ACP dehydrogenase [Skermania piniformis]
MDVGVPATGLDSGESVRRAAEFAAEVDRKARFPKEAVEAMRADGLLSASLPAELGGRSASITELAAVARKLGRACSSAAMVYAMHHTQALSLRFHAADGPIAELTREIAREEALLASATTEITTGGDTGSSTCAVARDGDTVTLAKNAPIISYATYADYICATARRDVDSPASDQVLVVCPKGDTTLEQTSEWDTLGFRGTCSPGFMLQTHTAARNVLPVPYSTISAHTMLPTSHTLWASVWLGIADAAVSKARTHVRSGARHAAGVVTPQMAKLADLLVIHQTFESSVAQEIQRYEEFLATGEPEPTIGFALAMNNLKLSASLAVVDVVVGALALCGINGYREDHPASMGRLLRDSYGPQVMVSNDRIRVNNAKLVLAHRGQG